MVVCTVRDPLRRSWSHCSTGILMNLGIVGPVQGLACDQTPQRRVHVDSLILHTYPSVVAMDWDCRRVYVPSSSCLGILVMFLPILQKSLIAVLPVRCGVPQSHPIKKTPVGATSEVGNGCPPFPGLSGSGGPVPDWLGLKYSLLKSL